MNNEHFLAKYGDSDHLMHVLKSGKIKASIDVFRHASNRLEQKHIDTAQNSDYASIRSWVADHPLADVDKSVNDPDKSVRESSIRHPRIQHHHIEKLLYDPDSAVVRHYASIHPLTTDNDRLEHQKIINKTRDDERFKRINSYMELSK